uniref:Uncharacterized protein n=1 Tax=Angiostrongylus cantonensis TaxID=6313 RepID=A0A0K0DHG5_ANGCA
MPNVLDVVVVVCGVDDGRTASRRRLRRETGLGARAPRPHLLPPLAVQCTLPQPVPHMHPWRASVRPHIPPGPITNRSISGYGVNAISK